MKAARGYFLLFLFTIFLATSACQAEPKVTITTKAGREVAFYVEVANTPAKRELGLQYRKDLATDRGMLFLFAHDQVLTFWMKNTTIPLDMVFIGQDGKIVGIVEEAVPFSLDSRSVSAPSRYVLEINGGLSRRYGFKAGDPVRLDGVSPENVSN
jgi:uncharacterized membrane protein (UPF0127 family)